MTFPEFNENGDLPVGIYEANLWQVVEHFGRENKQLAAIGGEQAAIEDWQYKRDETRRGIVEVIEND